MTVQDPLTTARTQIERRIRELIPLYCAPDAAALDAPACGVLCDAVTRQASVSSEGGKRLRALLLMAVFDLLHGGNGDADDNDDDDARAHALDVACAIEVFQTAALVHDDIIDEADTRRGKPAAHKALAAFTEGRYADVEAHGAAVMGNGLGIMLGDLLATASVGIVNAAAAGLPNHERIVSEFLAMHRDVEVGQVLDLAAEHLSLDDPEALAGNSLSVFRWKTASYTTIAPLRLAMLAAGVAPDVASALAGAIGTPLGVAFQLADDLLDVTADTASTGKPVGGDIREGKRTVLLADAICGADADDARYLKDRFRAAGRGDDDVRRIIALFRSTGAVERSRGRIRGLWADAGAAIDRAARELGLDEAGRGALRTACARFIPADLRD